MRLIKLIKVVFVLMHLLREASLLPDCSNKLSLCDLLDLGQLGSFKRATHPKLTIHALTYLIMLAARVGRILM